MASCKDCIHEIVCNYFEVDLNEEGAEKCVCFKDRNRFVELPCEVKHAKWENVGDNLIMEQTTIVGKYVKTGLNLSDEEYHEILKLRSEESD